jgi:hypothetical protein
MSDRSFTGVYYPFSLPLSDETLKRALLIFDELVFIDPLTPRVRSGAYDEATHQQHLPSDAPRLQRMDWEASERTLGPIIAAGAARYFDPTPLLDADPVHQAITATLQADMGRAETFNLFVDAPPGWSTLRSRIPRSTFPFLHHQYTMRVFYEENLRQPFSKELGFHAIFADGKPDQEYGMPPYPGSRPDVEGEYACVVPYYLGSSLAVSLAIAVCDEVRGLPFTDSRSHMELLQMRFTAAGNVAPQEYRLALLDAALSAEDLASVGIDQVLEMRSLLDVERRSVSEQLLPFIVGDRRSSGEDWIDSAALDASEASSNVLAAYEQVTSTRPEALAFRSTSRVYRRPDSRLADALAPAPGSSAPVARRSKRGPAATLVWIDPAKREFAPETFTNKPALQLHQWPDDALAPPPTAQPDADLPTTRQPDIATQGVSARRPWWKFLNRSR